MTNLINTDDPGTGEMSTTNMIVWLVRIALPILFFFIWYRSGPGKESSPGPTKHRRSRDELLDARMALGRCDKPAECPGIIPRSEIPESSSTTRQNSRNNQAARSKRGDKARNVGGSDYLGFKQDRALSSEFDLDFDGDTASNIGIQAIAPPVIPKIGRASLNTEEHSQFEALLNFAALAHKGKPKPTFLCTKERPPPPPPKKIPLATELGESDDSAAQTILKALVNEKIGLKCPDLANDLYNQLFDCDSRITEQTFTLIVEACVNAGDFKMARHFLMEMEKIGLSPDADLLDKVMDLFTQKKTEPVSPTPESATDMKTMVPEIEHQIQEDAFQKKAPPWGSGKSSQKNQLVNSSTGDPMETYADLVDEIHVPEPQCSPIPGDDLDDDIFEPVDSGFTRQLSQEVEVAEVQEQPIPKEEKPDESERFSKPTTKKADRKARKVKDRTDQQKNDDEILDEALEAATAERQAHKEELREEINKKETGKKRWADEESAKFEAVRKKEMAESEAAERQEAAEKAAKAARELEAQRAAEERERVTNSLDSLTASCAEEFPSKPEPKGRKDKSSSDKKKKDKGSTPKAAASVSETVVSEIVAEVETNVSQKNEKDDATQDDVAPDPQVAVSEVTVAEESFETGFETAVTIKQKKASRAQQRAEEKEAKRKEEEEEQERKRAAQEAARAAEEAARVAEEAARAAQETTRSVEETPQTTKAPAALLTAPVEQFFQAAKVAEAKQKSVSSLPEKEGGSDRTPLEKEIMKLEKKLREVEKLKERMEAGETLAPNQLDKVTKLGDTLGPKIAELQLQRALERAQEKAEEQSQFQEDRQFQDSPQDFEIEDRPEYSPGTPEPGDLPPIPMQPGLQPGLQPPTRTPLRQWARDARGATPFVGTPGLGPGVFGKGMPQVGMVGFAPQGNGAPQDGDGSNGMPMPAPFCVPCPPANGDLRTPLALPPDQEGNPPQFVPMFGGPEVPGAPVFCMPSIEMANDQAEKWESCWEWVRSGWCPRGATCRWNHPPIGTQVDFENGLHMQQLWPEGEIDPGGPPHMVLVSTGLPGGDFAPMPNGIAMPPLAVPMVPLGEDESAQQDDMPVTPRDDM